MQKRKKNHWPVLFAVLIVIILAWAIVPNQKRSSQTKQTSGAPKPPDLTYTQEQATQLIDALFREVLPTDPKNSAMPLLMKQKIQWVYNEFSAKRLKFYPTVQYHKNADGSVNEKTVMDSTKESDGNSAINIYVTRLMILVRLQHKNFSGFSRIDRNMFALMLAHESLHLEQPTSFFQQTKPEAQYWAEEDRAWFHTIAYMVRPMREAQEPLDIDFIQMDDQLKTCGYSLQACAGKMSSFLKGNVGANH